jgi:hypothetical protein
LVLTDPLGNLLGKPLGSVDQRQDFCMELASNITGRQVAAHNQEKVQPPVANLWTEADAAAHFGGVQPD